MQLERLINILEMTALAGGPVTVSNLQKATGLPRPTCYRLVQTLTNHRLLNVEKGSSRYVIGDRLIRLALLGKSDIDVRRATASSLKEAAIHLGSATFLARLRNKRVEIIHVETPDDPSLAFIHPGLGHRPLHACSSAKAIAAFTDDDLQSEILGSILEKFNSHTNTDREKLTEEFSTIRKLGYAQCDQEINLGVSSVAAPVKIGEVGVTFSVGAVGHAKKYDSEMRQQTGKYLGGLASKVEAAIQLCNIDDI